MAQKLTTTVVGASDPTVNAQVNADESIPEAYQAATTRLRTRPGSPAEVLGWLTLPQLIDIAGESGVANPSGYTDKAELVEAIMLAKGLVYYDAGDDLALTIGVATINDSLVAGVNTQAVTGTLGPEMIILTPVDGAAGQFYITNIVPGAFQIAATDPADEDRQVLWAVIPAVR